MDLTRERYDWRATVGAGLTEELLVIEAAPQPRVLYWYGTGDVYSVTVQLRGLRAQPVYTFDAPDGGGDRFEVPANVAAEVSVTAGSTDVVTHLAVRDGRADECPPRDYELDHLVEGAAQAPGVWANASNNVGFAPPGRYHVDVFTGGAAAVDFRLLDADGNERAVLQAFGHLEIYQPPRSRLQARHPGAGTDTRTALVVYRKL